MRWLLLNKVKVLVAIGLLIVLFYIGTLSTVIIWPINGMVVDPTSQAPLPNIKLALEIPICHLIAFESSCLEDITIETTTDSNGHFNIPFEIHLKSPFKIEDKRKLIINYDKIQDWYLEGIQNKNYEIRSYFLNNRTLLEQKITLLPSTTFKEEDGCGAFLSSIDRDRCLLLSSYGKAINYGGVITGYRDFFYLRSRAEIFGKCTVGESQEAQDKVQLKYEQYMCQAVMASIKNDASLCNNDSGCLLFTAIGTKNPKLCDSQSHTIPIGDVYYYDDKCRSQVIQALISEAKNVDFCKQFIDSNDETSFVACIRSYTTILYNEKLIRPENLYFAQMKLEDHFLGVCENKDIDFLSKYDGDNDNCRAVLAIKYKNPELCSTQVNNTKSGKEQDRIGNCNANYSNQNFLCKDMVKHPELKYICN